MINKELKLLPNNLDGAMVDAISLQALSYTDLPHYDVFHIGGRKYYVTFETTKMLMEMAAHENAARGHVTSTAREQLIKVLTQIKPQEHVKSGPGAEIWSGVHGWVRKALKAF